MDQREGPTGDTFDYGLAPGETYEPETIETNATVSIEPAGEGFKITTIVLETTGTVPEISKDVFVEHAEKAKATCPVSQALAGAEIQLKATLQSQLQHN